MYVGADGQAGFGQAMPPPYGPGEQVEYWQVGEQQQGGGGTGLQGNLAHAGRGPLVSGPGGGFASWVPQLTVEERIGDKMAKRVFTSFPSFTAFGESLITRYRLAENSQTE